MTKSYEEVSKNLKEHLLKIIDAIPRVLDESKNPYGCIDQSLFTQVEEVKLFACLNYIRPQIEKYITNHEYTEALTLLCVFRDPVEVFFDNVKVDVEDQSLRRNRLALIYEVTATFRLIADFSKIEGVQKKTQQVNTEH